ncbi:hypothetical protein [Oerskovia sp. KBS0722]|uniref:hypothetical protein n=1 Tax=Oerskovia sp. KBS0722 TaxID=1179673 RepID=UPI00110D4046|nr:hypothetical protein [Oerskovia sp. KBS0722]QDW61729.1 hypothetical protein FFI11_003600 [Oerskovia sp. KBS0722]
MANDSEIARSHPATGPGLTTDHHPTNDPDAPAPNLASRITAGKKRGESFVLDDEGLVRDEVARQVIAFVSTYHREHKRGPTWMEVGVCMGWSRPETVGAIGALRRVGILYATRSYRSLRVHPRLTARRRRAR